MNGISFMIHEVVTAVGYGLLLTVLTFAILMGVALLIGEVIRIFSKGHNK